MDRGGSAGGGPAAVNSGGGGCIADDPADGQGARGLCVWRTEARGQVTMAARRTVETGKKGGGE